MPSSPLYKFGPLGHQVMVTKPRDGSPAGVYMVRKSLIAQKEPCKCARCQWNKKSTKERETHQTNCQCFCPKCDHERDAKPHGGHNGNNNANKNNNNNNQNQNNKEQGKGPNEINDAKDGNPNQHEAPILTDHQKSRLRELKLQGVGHPKIATELGISKKDVQTAWQEMTKGEGNDNNNNAGSAEQANSGKKVENQNQNQNSQNKSDKVDLKMPVPDKHMSQKDISAAHKIIDEELPKMWLKVAQKFYTETGKAIHPDDLEAKFSGQA